MTNADETVVVVWTVIDRTAAMTRDAAITRRIEDRGGDRRVRIILMGKARGEMRIRWQWEGTGTVGRHTPAKEMVPRETPRETRRGKNRMIIEMVKDRMLIMDARRRADRVKVKNISIV